VELRHLRYFLAVGEALNFTKAAARLRVAQPALGRQVQDLEDEIGVDLLRRSPRGVTLTAEGKLFLEEARELLKRVDESVEKTRALARGEYGELHIGYIPIPTAEVLRACGDNSSGRCRYKKRYSDARRLSPLITKRNTPNLPQPLIEPSGLFGRRRNFFFRLAVPIRCSGEYCYLVSGIAGAGSKRVSGTVKQV
jgi:regulatory helix-turn-helix LysR family protein